MKNKYRIKYFSKIRVKFNDFFYNLDERFKGLSDDEAIDYLKKCKKIRIMSQVIYVPYFILVKLGLLKFITFHFFVISSTLFCFIFIVLYAILYGMEAAHSSSPFLVYKKNEKSQLSELTLKKITREKFINFFMFILIILILQFLI